MKPKAFISYSWSSESYREMIRNWADRLLADGIEIVLDQYDLKEGQDKYAFMEKMVTDSSFTHVLVICDKAYAEKADSRKAGVGTESQIISQEVYNKVDQSKFIPIWSELSEAGEPYLPTFMKSRIGINFSTPELVNENWEQLIRLLFGKPLYQKPVVGNAPAYILEEQVMPSNPAVAKFASLKQALIQGKKGVAIYRDDFISACFKYADSLRIRTPPDLDNLGEQILKDYGKLIQIRDLITDWILLEASSTENSQFEDQLSATLEKLIELRSRPAELNSWNEVWFDALRLFVYETFLYIVAALLKVSAFKTLHEILTSNYLKPESERHNPDNRFIGIEVFWASSEAIALTPPNGGRYLSPTAELMKRQATRADLPFNSVIEAELMICLICALKERSWWFPQTLFYARYEAFPFFVRATQQKHFKKLSQITGIETADELRNRAKQGFERMRIDQWRDFSFHASVSFWSALNMDKLDTIR